MIVVTGATGNTGRTAAEALLTAEERIRVIGRSAEKLQPLAAKGAEAFPADVLDTAALTRAFTGADAVYLMIPPEITVEDYRAYQERVSDSLVAAVKAAGVPRVVVLSSVGADKSERTGPILGLHHLEEKIKALGTVNAIFLRPNYFMDNSLMQIGLIHTMGMMASTYHDDLPIAQIATGDIGRAAADTLRQLNFTGCQARDLYGPRDVTLDETAKILGAAVGKPQLSYKKVPEFMAQMGMRQMGMTEKTAKLMLEMADSFNSGWIQPIEPRSAQNTVTTTIETWATDVFAPAFNSKK
jgi:uncharacterized protein YbjT (DUF2867 family)